MLDYLQRENTVVFLHKEPNYLGTYKHSSVFKVLLDYSFYHEQKWKCRAKAVLVTRISHLNGGITPSLVLTRFRGARELESSTILLLKLRWTMHGMDQGKLFRLQPTGKQATWKEIQIGRFADGKLEEHWISFDRLDML